MSIGPLGLVSSIATTPLSLAKGSEVQRAQQDAAAQAREAQSGERAEAAGGLGEAEGEKEVNERDADGRRLWERALAPNKPPNDLDQNSAEPPPASKDPTGQAGRNLDLSG